MKFISQETSSLQCRCRSLKESLFSLLQRRNVKTCTKMRHFVIYGSVWVGPYTTNVSPHPQDRIPDMEGRKLDFSAASGTEADNSCQEGVIQNQQAEAVLVNCYNGIFFAPPAQCLPCYHIFPADWAFGGSWHLAHWKRCCLCSGVLVEIWILDFWSHHPCNNPRQTLLSVIVANWGSVSCKE
jgi:hypothetical protein